jgi:hypothetical protein
MPTKSVKILPGVNVERTPTLNEAGISYSSFGRFRDGLFQKVGGWQQYYNLSVGIPRAMHAWQDLNSVKHLAVGTTTAFATITNGASQFLTPQTYISNFSPNFTTTIGSAEVFINDSNISNVTTYDGVYFDTPVSVGGIILSGFYPIERLGALATQYYIVAASAATSAVTNGGAVPTFTTTSGSSVVSVTLPSNGLSVGSTIVFPIPTTAGGITISGSYTVTSVAPPNTFTINASATATSSAGPTSMNSGNCQLLYYITLGPAAAGVGYGTGLYGTGTFGYGVVPSAQTGTPITAANWTIDNWGQFAVACPKDGGIYYWDPNGGFSTLQQITTAPLYNRGIFVSMPQQILVAYGSTTQVDIGIEQDPLLVFWSDQGDFANWVPSSTTQAGSYHIPTGSEIVGGLQGPQNGLIWTDLDLWSMNYLGYPLVFGFTKVGANCGLIGQHAACQLRGSVYWMGQSNFFVFNGNNVQIIPCPIWDYVFQNLDTTNQGKCVAAANTAFNEVWWFFPSSSGSGEPDSYVKYNIVEGVWDFGQLSRTAWIDQSVLGQPLGATVNSVIYQHETTNDADGVPIVSTMRTGYFAVNEGHEMTFIDMVWPDFKYGTYGNPAPNAQIQVTIYGADYPNDIPVSYGTYVVSPNSVTYPNGAVSQATWFNMRVRNRLLALQFQSADLGSFWRIGNVRIRFAQDGKI